MSNLGTPSKSTEPDPSINPSTTSPIFSPDEEASLLTQSHAEKASANKTFTSGDYSSAIQGYEKALAVCPTYLEYDIAVLRSNISACHIKLQEWKLAVESATQALEALDRVDPMGATETRREYKGGGGSRGDADQTGKKDVGGGVVEEVDDEAEARIEALTRTGHTISDVHKLRIKALLRRAKARREVGGWASLQGSLEDYQRLDKNDGALTSMDAKTVRAALRELPPRLEETKNQEMADMMGKLKQLGNGILKPFGLSTDNFQFTKDEKTGGYGMQFNQNAK